MYGHQLASRLFADPVANDIITHWKLTRKQVAGKLFFDGFEPLGLSKSLFQQVTSKLIIKILIRSDFKDLVKSFSVFAIY